VFRSRAGEPSVLLEAVREGRKDDDPTGDDNDDGDDDGLISRSEADSRHNSHWLHPLYDGEGGPSRYVAYYDAASLYPSSGESTFSPVGASFARVEGRERSLDLGQAR